MKKLILLILIVSVCTAYGQVKEKTYFEMQEYSKDFFESQGENPGAKNKWLNRWLWNNRFDFDKSGNLLYLNQNYSYDYLKIKEKNKNQILSETGWQPLGPIQIPPTYVPRSCYAMGRINCIAFHPTNQNSFWIGTPNGGIWKTEDYGQTWIPQGDNLAAMSISHIAVNPQYPMILYAATGDFDTSGMTSGNTSGVIKSTDGGDTWAITNLMKSELFGNSSLRKIIIHPDSTEHFLVAGRKGIFKTLDGGESWYKVCDSIISDMEIHPKNSAILYAAMSQLNNGGSAGVLKSTDFGETWVDGNVGMPPQGEISRVEISISPADPNYVYALGVNVKTNAFHSLWRTTNGGDSWQMQSQIDTTNNILGAWGGDAADRTGQGSYDLVLIAAPYDKDKIYTGGINIWMSENGGQDWQMASFWIYVFGESIHADHHYADFNPLDKKFYWANDGGIYRTSEIGLGDKDWVNNWINKHEENLIEGAPDVKFPTVWENLNDGLAITEFYRVSLSKNNNYVLAGGSQDNSCYYYNNGDWLNYIPNYDGMETMIDHNNTDIFYGLWQGGGLCKTTDGGKTIQTRLNAPINEPGLWVTPACLDPLNTNHIFIGYRNFWESFDGGTTWSKLLDFKGIDSTTLNNRSISIIKTEYNDNKHISIYKNSSYYYIDSTKTWVRVPGELWITNDAGKSWEKSHGELPLDSLETISLDYDKSNPDIIWAAIYSYNRNLNLYRTDDGGANWRDISQPLPPGIRLNCIVHQPSDHNHIYAGTNKGVFRMSDSTDLWEPFSLNLPNTVVNDLEYQESTLELIAATYGRGIWKTNAMPLSVEENQDIISQISIIPIPVTNEIHIRINNENLNSSGKIQIRILDITGAEIFKGISDMTNDIVLNPNLVSGVYFLVMKINGKDYTGKFIVKK